MNTLKWIAVVLVGLVWSALWIGTLCYLFLTRVALNVH